MNLEGQGEINLSGEIRFSSLTGPCFVHAVVDKESSEFNSGGGASGSGGLDSERAVDQENQGEETQPKQLLRQDNTQGAQLGSVLVVGMGVANIEENQGTVCL